MQGPWRSRTQPATAGAPAGAFASRPSLGLDDVLVALRRERALMLVVFIAVMAVGVAFALHLKKMYPAHSSLLIRLGQEYVYNPRVGDAGRGAAPQSDQVIQSEVEILSSSILKERVIQDIGLDRLFPALGRAAEHASPDKRRDIEGQAIRSIESNLKIATAPDTSVVRITYSHPDPQMAATVLNTLIDEYLNYRKTVLIARDAGAIDEERRAFQKRLDEANAAYEQFLIDNGIGDFDAEKTALGQIYSQLMTERYSVEAQLSEVEGRLGVTAREAAETAPEIGLYRDVDHTAADKLLQLRLQRQDLLSRYRPNALPVRDLDRQIAALEAIASTGQATGPGARRVGINPVYQTLETDRDQLTAQEASLRARRAALNAELAEVTRRREQLVQLEPEYDNLARRRDLLGADVRNLAAREQESQAAEALAQRADNDVRVVERAFVPSQGVSLRKPALILTFIFAVFTALCAGLARAFLRPGYPTAGSAGRTLDLPVLATAPMQGAEG